VGWKQFIWLLALLLAAPGLACAGQAITDHGGGPDRYELADLTKNGVSVVISLERPAEETATLVGVFTPQDTDAHLYSLDLPLEGENGLGRPTLLELAPGSVMQADGSLRADQTAEIIQISPDLPLLPVYPAGAVTLRLPVRLPEDAEGSFADQVLVTYMVCSPRGCLRPVMGERIEIEVPRGR
jgi:hypothetical protein